MGLNSYRYPTCDLGLLIRGITLSIGIPYEINVRMKSIASALTRLRLCVLNYSAGLVTHTRIAQIRASLHY